MIVFGGWTGKVYFNDVWLLDLQTMAWARPATSGPEPSPRKGHSAVLIGTNLIIHGGFYQNQEAKQSPQHAGTSL